MRLRKAAGVGIATGVSRRILTAGFRINQQKEDNHDCKKNLLALTLATGIAVSATVAQAQSTNTEQSANQPATQGGGILYVLEQ